MNKNEEKSLPPGFTMLLLGAMIFLIIFVVEYRKSNSIAQESQAPQIRAMAEKRSPVELLNVPVETDNFVTNANTNVVAVATNNFIDIQFTGLKMK